MADDFDDIRQRLAALEEGLATAEAYMAAERELYAHAPTDLARLLAEVERLRAVVREQDAAFGDYCRAIDWAGQMYYDVTQWPMDPSVQGPIDAAEQRFARAGEVPRD